MVNTALIVVDVQNDFISGSLAVNGGDVTAKRIAEYREETKYDFTVATLDWHIDPGDHFSDEPDYVNSWPVHCKAGFYGASLHSSLKARRFDARFFKGLYTAAYSGFEGRLDAGQGALLNTWLDSLGVTEVDVCGIATDYCVKATALDAVKLGYRTRVLLPLTAAVAAESGQAAIDEMTDAGVEMWGQLL